MRVFCVRDEPPLLYKRKTEQMITIGQTVSVNFIGKLKDGGEVFDTTEGRDPHTFRLGQDRLMPGFLEALIGKEIGEKFTVEIPKEKAYGEYNEKKITEVPKGFMPGEVEVGQILEARGTNDESAAVVVIEIKEDSVVLDGNHPLAGMDLVFDIEIVNAE